MSRRICIVTGTRAEYGLLRGVIQGVQQAPGLTLQLLVTGAHLSPESGLTYRETEADERSMPPAAAGAWQRWYASTPDAPCIAICSTAQGDAVCKGCGRTEHEVQHWTTLGPAEKRAVWLRITREGTAWRFNRYAERARLAGGATGPGA